MLIGVLQLLVAMGPSVAVEVAAPEEGAPIEDASSETSMPALRSWLVQRLVEEGVTIAPGPEQADRVVRLSDSEDSVVVETNDDRYEIEHGPAAVMRLELLHRARLFVEESGEPTAPSPAADAHVIGLRSFGDAPIGFEGRLESELLTVGYVLTSQPRAGDRVLCVRHGETELAASAADAGDICGGETVEVEYRRLGAAHSLDQLVALIEGEPVAAAPPEPQPIIGPMPEPSGPDKPKRRRRWSREDAEVRLGAEAGALVRGGVDASVRAFTRIGLAPGPGAMLQVQVVPSRAGSVRVVDTILAAGPDLYFGRKRVGFEAGVLAGARVHAFAVDLDAGGRVDWYLGLPAAVSFGRKKRGLRAHLFTETSVTGASQEHRVGNDVRWNRTAWGFRVGLGISYGWRIL